MAKKDSLPSLPGLGKPKKLPKPHRFAVAPTGPEHLHLGEHPNYVGWITEAPPGFVGPHNSVEEWWVYQSISKHMKDPIQFWLPPFTGSRVGNWAFQHIEGQGRVPGGSITDFQVKTPTGWIGIRLDTERWHIFAGPNQQLKDLFIKTHIKAVQKVITIFSQDFIHDETGAACMKVVALALRGIEMMNPIRAGTAQRRRMRTEKK